MRTVYIGLGSNLSEPVCQLENAIAALKALPLTTLQRRSSFYKSAPVGPQDQPDFVNAVIELGTRLSPLALLDQLQAIEQAHRRVRARHWGPRTLDLDMLWCSDTTMHTHRLNLPHPEMHRRAFVLEPLSELAPDLLIGEWSVKHLATTLNDQHIDKLLE
ncbi:2-amino-4-hydroxy-6-hydroxymethyldihydropteridine diphosphokinase [Larsenimonas salina]|uniref:2-amino-4-hydroxy-6- hydroxymethyldihydropteridine diphosphokinase n=1 Tax=Larsenimonas salina TaxID=1295565 RepID=UPI002074A99A|nr:2-amino-4-hydroxy-6-hydroxymethyldihydropteridine diphosphokinase [Larsenimonas salina]MCM5705312.1 2-amino-4-hydroxy-6-hydroxymethyldihydropteridine diphosphokinase [Larsenimonas salina]